MSTLLYELAEQSASQPSRLASVLLPYARARGWNREQLANQLGCSLEVLPHILLTHEEAPGSRSWNAAAIVQQWSASSWKLPALLQMALAYCGQNDRVEYLAS